MAKELNDIPKFKRSFWKKIGDKVADSIRIDTTKKGIDVRGSSFNKYSEKYRIRKSKGGLKRQSST